MSSKAEREEFHIRDIKDEIYAFGGVSLAVGAATGIADYAKAESLAGAFKSAATMGGEVLAASIVIVGLGVAMEKGFRKILGATKRCAPASISGGPGQP